MLCLRHYGPTLLKSWFQLTDAFHFSHDSHALVTQHAQFLCSDWSKFDRWVHAEKCIACQSRKSDFGWHPFRFSPCLMSKGVEKSQAILALLDSFQELHVEWQAWVIIVFVFFYISNFIKSRAVYEASLY